MCVTGYTTYRLSSYQKIINDNYNDLLTVSESLDTDDTNIIVTAQVANVPMSTLEFDIAKAFNFMYSEAVYNCGGKYLKRSHAYSSFYL